MQTITFYSYKGGTGRTLLLANVAVLAARLGRRVVALDADLEAPGLGYKLLNHPPQHCAGLVGWLRERLETGEVPESLDDATVDAGVVEPFVEGGWLKLMPAGSAPSVEYFQEVADLRLDERIAAGDGVDAFLDLQSQIRDDLKPDLLLIDARTGVTGSNRVTTRVLADHVVALTLDSPEQLEGTRAVLRSLTPLTSLRTEEALGLHVALSRIASRPPEVGSFELTSLEREQAERVRAFLCAPADPLRLTLSVDRVHLLHTEPSLIQGDFLPLARTRMLDATVLHVDYLRVAESLLGGAVGETATQILGEAADSQERESLARFFARTEDVQAARSERFGRDVELDARRGDNRALRVERLRNAARHDPALVPDFAAALSDLADGFDEVGDHERSIAARRESIAVWKELVGRRTSVAAELNSLGISLAAAGRHEEALESTNRSVSLWREIASEDSEGAGRELAVSLNNLAVDLGRLGRTQEAAVAMREAVELFREAATRGEPEGELEYGESLVRLAFDLYEAGEASEATTNVIAAVDYLQELAERGVADARNALARALDLLSVRSDDAKESVIAARRAVSERRLAIGKPGVTNVELAVSLGNLAEQHAKAGDHSQAITAIAEAIEILRGENLDDPRGTAALLAESLNELGVFLSRTGEHDQALAASTESVAVWRRVGASDSFSSVDFGRALRNLAVDAFNVGDTGLAVDAAREYVALARDLGPEELADALNRLAVLLLGVNRLAEAHETADEAVALLREQDLSETAAQRGLATALRTRASAGIETDAVRAIADAKESASLLSAVIEQEDDDETLRLLALSVSNLAVDLKRLGHSEQSLSEKQTAVTLWRRVARQDPSSNRQLAIALQDLATGFAHAGRLDEALPPAGEAVEILRVEEQRVPGTGGADLVGALRNLGALRDVTGDPLGGAEARDEAERATADLLERPS